MFSQQQVSYQNITNKSLNIRTHLKSVIFIMCGIVLGLIAFIPFNSNTAYYLFKLLQVSLFFLLGTAYLISLKRYFFSRKIEVNTKNRSFYIALCLCVALSCLYALTKKASFLVAFGSSAAFILPFCINISWIYFLNIPYKEYNIWIPRKRISNTVSIFLDCFFIKIKIAKRNNEILETIYSVYAPHYIKLGDFFSRFLNNQKHNPETAIEDIDNKKNHYAWEFFITDLYGLQIRRLDPDLSLTENKIKQDATISVKRVKQPVKLLSYPKNLLNENIKP